jgi:phenylalanyl-tRNA synthetase beta chain
VEAVLAAAGTGWRAEAAPRPWLHPGRAATVVSGGGEELGWLGELHPLVARHWDLEGATAAFELDVDAIARLGSGPASFTDLTSFPAVLEDIAVIVGEEVSAAEIEDAVREGGGALLAGTRVFDLYRGEQVGEGNKSIALRLEFRAPDRTLTDAEVAEVRRSIESALERIGGRLRGG